MIALKRATPEAIKYACLNFHYAKRIPSVMYGYNVYNDGEWCGTICFGQGAQHGIASAIGYEYGEVLELLRVALNGKQPCTSECVAAAVRQLHKDAPQIKALVSYADQNQGHLGIIYQATNWIYIGDTKEISGTKPDAFIIHGKKMHPRSVGSAGWRQSLPWLRENVDPEADAVWGLPKYKYIFVYDKRQRREWLKKALPYPKQIPGGDTH